MRVGVGVVVVASVLERVLWVVWLRQVVLCRALVRQAWTLVTEPLV